MIDYLKTITVWQAAAWILGLIAGLALLIKYWHGIKPIFSKLTSCLRKSKANQEMLEDHDEKLIVVQQDVKAIKKSLSELAADSREYRKTSLSDKIFKKYQAYKKAGQVTRDQIVNFNICTERYKKCLLPEEMEADIVLNKYYTEVMNLDVKQTADDH